MNDHINTVVTDRNAISPRYDIGHSNRCQKLIKQASEISVNLNDSTIRGINIS